MTMRMRAETIAFAAALALAAAPSSRAAFAEETLSDSIERFLDDAEEQVKNARASGRA